MKTNVTTGAEENGCIKTGKLASVYDISHLWSKVHNIYMKPSSQIRDEPTLFNPLAGWHASPHLKEHLRCAGPPLIITMFFLKFHEITIETLWWFKKQTQQQNKIQISLICLTNLIKYNYIQNSIQMQLLFV